MSPLYLVLSFPASSGNEVHQPSPSHQLQCHLLGSVTQFFLPLFSTLSCPYKKTSLTLFFPQAAVLLSSFCHQNYDTKKFLFISSFQHLAAVSAFPSLYFFTFLQPLTSLTTFIASCNRRKWVLELAGLGLDSCSMWSWTNSYQSQVSLFVKCTCECTYLFCLVSDTLHYPVLIVPFGKGQ